MKKLIRIHNGFDPATNEPVYIEREIIECSGFPSLKDSPNGIDPVHFRVHIDFSKPAKRRRNKDVSNQAEMSLNDPVLPKQKKRGR